MKEITLRLNDLKNIYFKEKLNRLNSGFPDRFKRTKPRDREKEKALLNFLLRVTPPAEEILSGKAFKKIMKALKNL